MESKVDNLIQVPDGHVSANALCRLGNQMFIAASAITYAKRTGREFVGLTKTDNKNDYPENLMNTVMRNVKYVDKSVVSDYYKMPHGGWLCNGFPNTDVKDIWFNDFYQDARCIDKDIAYNLFKPYDSILRVINDLYGDLSDTVCINVRRGDYLRVQSLGFRILSVDGIKDIINAHFSTSDKFLFVSDDIQWCKNNFHGGNYRFVDKPYENKPEIDLYIQTQCKANVISNSTFSWWGAYLNSNAKKVVCPWPWFHSGKINEMRYILPENWIKYTGKP